MSLRDDIRSALSSVAASLPDAAHTLAHGEFENGVAVQGSSCYIAAPISADEPAEATRLIVDASRFPTLANGHAVSFDGSLRVVTSLVADPVSATLTVGVSQPFEQWPVIYSIRRRSGNSVRANKFPLDILLLENGTASGALDAFGPTASVSYTAIIRRDDWPENTDPEPADTIDAVCDGVSVALKVSSSVRHDGWYILNCRTRG